MTKPAGFMTRFSRRFVDIFHNPVTAWVILGIGLLLTFSAWYISNSLVQRSGRERFEYRALEITEAIHSRMIGYEQILISVLAMFNASEEVRRGEFKAFVDTLNLSANWPGVQGIGYSIPLSPAEKQAHIEAIRAEGFPDYTIKPEDPREEYTSIIYLEPFDWRNKRAFGYDMWSNDMRRAAMTRARDTGQASTSGIITLVQETNEDTQRGFLTYLPRYQLGRPLTNQEERRAAFLGWVYAPFRMGDLMAGILGSGRGDVAYEIFDGTEVSEETMLFDSNQHFTGLNEGRGDWVIQTNLELQGRLWTLRFAAGDGFLTSTEENQPLGIALAGLIVDLLLFYVITSLALLNKRAESMANEMTEEIRHTNSLLEDKIRESDTLVGLLSKTNEELSHFAFVASHDLREPLRKIKIFIDMLRAELGGGISKDSQNYMEVISSGAMRMDALLSSLLTYSRISAKAVAFQWVNLNEVLVEVLADLAVSIEEHNAQIQIADLPKVEGDPTQLRQLFQNLVSNSLKYQKDQEKPDIRIESRLDPHWLCLTVVDNGIGFDNEYKEKIFEVFQRLHGKHEYPGTGIGLAICRKIMERHRGSISAESIIGQGTTMVLKFPRKVDP